VGIDQRSPRSRSLGFADSFPPAGSSPKVLPPIRRPFQTVCRNKPLGNVFPESVHPVNGANKPADQASRLQSRAQIRWNLHGLC